MAGSLIKIDEEIVTSAVASVTLTGIDSTYDVYMVKHNNVTVSTTAFMYWRVTKSGTDDSTANYDYAMKQLSADRAFSNFSGTNATQWPIDAMTNTDNLNGIFYLFNFNNASEYSFATWEQTKNESGNLRAEQGGGVHTVASASDGFFLTLNTGNITAGTFTLYGLKK